MDNVEDIQRGRQRENVRLLQELAPHLGAARAVERELDRHLARRFNAFRYLRDDELGLSRIIADLLDPTAEHGQGTSFLEAMFELLPEVPVDQLGSTAAATIRVEREITEHRRIDITVDIPAENGTFCLAFENKPYADDQYRQCRDYLKFLENRYEGRFLLVYLPPRYRMPDESSLPPKDRNRWKNHFRVLPYCREDATPDADTPATEGSSLAEWFGICHALCDAERLRWFLREGQLYCRQQFGDSTMTDTEANYIREYLEKNPKHLPAAFAVARAWEVVKHDVCRRFLEHLRDRVEEQVSKALPAIGDDLDIRCHYGEDKKFASYLRVYRKAWARYEGVMDPKSDGRTTVMLECGHKGPTWWCWGVRSAKQQDDMTETEKERHAEVESALQRRDLSLQKSSSQWPQWEETRHENWTAIVPELVGELAAGGGKISDYYVNGLIEIIEKATPAIDQFELKDSTSSASHDS